MKKTTIGKLFETAIKHILKKSLFKIAEDKQKYLTQELKKIFAIEFIIEEGTAMPYDNFIQEQYNIYYFDDATNKRHVLSVVTTREI